LDRVLIPSTRWFLRRRINRVINEIGTRLDIEIRPFQLTKRQVLIDRLIYDPQIIEAIKDYAGEHDMPQEVAQGKVAVYAREIVPSFNAYLYFRIGYWIAKKIARLLYRVRVGLLDGRQYALLDPDSTVVFVMNHRSNMDYILVAFLAAERTTLSYAVGEWAKIWPLQMLIRAMGAFFVRRRSGNPLYRKVLERYIHMATREGVCQAVFPEGGLSRDGRLQKPKLGLFDYMLRGFNRESDRDIVFVPVGINYDRTLERDADRRSWWFALWTTSRFIANSLVLMILSRWRRYGYACVNFGTPVSMKDYCRETGTDFSTLERSRRFTQIEILSNQLMKGIASVVPVLPVALVSTVFLETPMSEMDIMEIEKRSNQVIDEFKAEGAPIFEVPRSTRARTIADAVEFLKMRRLIFLSGRRFKVVPEEEATLRYYANSIGHWRK